MADVTFGVKVSEEMKKELSELMKSTQLTGKDFMNLLIHSYKLEKEKEKETVIASDLDELQQLLQRIQHLYINMNERTALVVDTKFREKDEVIEETLAEVARLKNQQQELNEKNEKQKKDNTLLKKALEDKEVELKELKNIIEQQKIQIKQQSLLEEKYEDQIVTLQEKIETYKRLDLEISERNEELTQLKTKNDELASEVWFAQREIEKQIKDYEMALEKKEIQCQQLKESYNLELTNKLLEQKLLFNQKIDLLKDEHYKIQQQLNEKIHKILEQKDKDKDSQ